MKRILLAAMLWLIPIHADNSSLAIRGNTTVVAVSQKTMHALINTPVIQKGLAQLGMAKAVHCISKYTLSPMALLIVTQAGVWVVTSSMAPAYSLTPVCPAAQSAPYVLAPLAQGLAYGLGQAVPTDKCHGVKNAFIALITGLSVYGLYGTDVTSLPASLLTGVAAQHALSALTQVKSSQWLKNPYVIGIAVTTGAVAASVIPMPTLESAGLLVGSMVPLLQESLALEAGSSLGNSWGKAIKTTLSKASVIVKKPFSWFK